MRTTAIKGQKYYIPTSSVNINFNQLSQNDSELVLRQSSDNISDITAC